MRRYAFAALALAFAWYGIGPGKSTSEAAAGSGRPVATAGVSHSASGRAGAAAVRAAARQIGDPYVWGADGPNAWDCSGLVIHGGWDAVGANWPDTTANGLGHHFPAIKAKSARPGDLVLWDWDHNGVWDHVALYAGAGQVVEAPRRGVPVRKIALSATGNGPGSYRRPSKEWW